MCRRLDKKIKEMAKTDYLNLVGIVRNSECTFEDLCNRLSGFNFQADYESFDTNFGCLTATIYEENESRFVYEYIDIWDDNKEKPVAESVSYTILFE